jgi:membrane protease YdiL (CAAX protease family)
VAASITKNSSELSGRFRRPLALVQIALVAIVFLGVKSGAQWLGLAFSGSFGVVGAVIAATIMLRLDGASWRELGLRAPTRLWSWVKLPLLVVGAMAATVLLAVIGIPALLGNLLETTQGGHAFDFLVGNLPALLLVLVFVAWGAAAFGEEMLFRGWLLNRLETLFGGTRLALVAALFGQAVIFGFGHSSQGALGIIITGSIGLIMGLVYLIGGRWLLPTIIAHGMIDTISLVQTYAGE